MGEGGGEMEEDKAKLKHGNTMPKKNPSSHKDLVPIPVRGWIFFTMPKKISSSHKDLAPIPVRGWIFFVRVYALTYLPEHYM